MNIDNISKDLSNVSNQINIENNPSLLVEKNKAGGILEEKSVIEQSINFNEKDNISILDYVSTISKPIVELEKSDESFRNQINKFLSTVGQTTVERSESAQDLYLYAEYLITEYTELIESMNEEIDIYNDSLGTYNDAVEKYSEAVSAYNDAVDAYNKGDISESEFLEFQNEYNQAVEDYNDAVNTYNDAVNAYNNAVSEYNQKAGELEEEINDLGIDNYFDIPELDSVDSENTITEISGTNKPVSEINNDINPNNTIDNIQDQTPLLNFYLDNFGIEGITEFFITGINLLIKKNARKKKTNIKNISDRTNQDIYNQITNFYFKNFEEILSKNSSEIKSYYSKILDKHDLQYGKLFSIIYTNVMKKIEDNLSIKDISENKVKKLLISYSLNIANKSSLGSFPNVIMMAFGFNAINDILDGNLFKVLKQNKFNVDVFKGSIEGKLSPFVVKTVFNILDTVFQVNISILNNITEAAKINNEISKLNQIKDINKDQTAPYLNKTLSRVFRNPKSTITAIKFLGQVLTLSDKISNSKLKMNIFSNEVKLEMVSSLSGFLQLPKKEQDKILLPEPKIIAGIRENTYQLSEIGQIYRKSDKDINKPRALAI